MSFIAMQNYGIEKFIVRDQLSNPAPCQQRDSSEERREKKEERACVVLGLSQHVEVSVTLADVRDLLTVDFGFSRNSSSESNSFCLSSSPGSG